MHNIELWPRLNWPCHPESSPSAPTLTLPDTCTSLGVPVSTRRHFFLGVESSGSLLTRFLLYWVLSAVYSRRRGGSISFLKVPRDDRFSERRVNASWKLFSPVSSFQLGLKLKNPEGGDISGYTTNGEWALIGTVTTSVTPPSTSYYYYVSQPTFSFKQWLSSK